MSPQNTIHRPSMRDEAELEHARQVAAVATQLLATNPTPDTFLGHKAQEPASKEKEGEHE